MEKEFTPNGFPEPKLPFDVPERFFEDFEEKLSARIDAMERKEEKKPVPLTTGRMEKLKPYLYFAAMFVLMFVTIRGIMHIRGEQSPEDVLSKLENAEEIHLEDITAEDILLSELDSYNLLYYLYGEEDSE